MTSDTDETQIQHQLKSEEDLYKEYKRLRQHLKIFWMYRPRSESFRSAFPGTVRELVHRVDFLEEILQIPEEDQFNSEPFDQLEIN